MPVGFPTKVNYATGDVLSATNMNDLSGTVNLLESAAESAAGVNKILNSDFGIWQRGTSFSNPASGSYIADRFLINYDGTGATRTLSQQTFTPGTAPVAGYEGTFFYRYAHTVAGTSGTYNNILEQYIEDVRVFAGQTVTYSFWAKAGSAISLTMGIAQNFGSGGSAVVGIGTQSISLTTAWTRFSYTVAIPSVAGKTIGTSSKLDAYVQLAPNTVATVDFWGVQVEAASTASDFKTATGTKQGELAACQRYYVRKAVTSAYGRLGGFGVATATNQIYVDVTLPVNFRTSTVSIDYGGALGVASQEGIFASFSSVTNNGSVGNNSTVYFVLSSGSMTVARSYYLQDNAAGTAYLGFSAEL